MVNSDKNNTLRSIPPMEELLNTDWALEYSSSIGREQVKAVISQAIDDVRQKLQKNIHDKVLPEVLIADRAKILLSQRSAGTLKTVANATGVVIHTNLGRSPLAGDALKAVNVLSGSYSTLEYDPEAGGRGGRNSHVESLICQMTGAEAALVVNNNAAALLLALSATAAGREVIVSAGELVEIGDSFRIPDILSFSGAEMVTVGCTNATRIGDFKKAITEKTAAFLKVHPSNYRIEGFTAFTSREELSELASSSGLVFIEDLGSGLLCPIDLPFENTEPTVRDCLKAGVSLVTFSGDKLLGGPQIGVIAGSKPLVDRMRPHQLYRALRVDKMTLAAFEATLRLYLADRQGEIPVIKMIETGAETLLKKANHLCRLLKLKAGGNAVADLSFSVVEADGVIGGGAFPTDLLPGYAVSIRSASRSAENLAAAFRMSKIPVIPAIRDGQVLLHVRTLLDGDDKIIVSALAGIVGGESV